MDEEGNIYKNRRISILGAIITALLLYYVSEMKDRKDARIEQDGKITTAKIIDYSGKMAKYEFYVGYRKFTSSQLGTGLDRRYIGDTFFVKFILSDDAVESTLLSNFLYSNCVGKPPLLGWDSIPECK
jgi:hypothetical protein